MGKLACSDKALIDMLFSGLSMTEVARQAEVSRERIRQVYNRRLSWQFGRLSPRQLAWARTTARRRRRQQEIPPNGEAVKKVWDLCKGMRIDVSRVPLYPGERSRNLSAKRLLIAGRRCLIYCARRSRCTTPTSKRRYFHVHTPRVSLSTAATWGEAEFLIVVVGEDRILVIPRAVFLSRTLCIPERPGLPIYNNRAPKVDWWAYENAWHLLSRTE
jgi:hypothetical protein